MSINNKLLEEELTEFCQSDSLSLDGLREIIERHGAAPKLDIDYKFFHAACDNERLTEGILRYLLEYFPNAVRNADGYVSNGEERVGGCTPLHVICLNKNVTLAMLQLLVDAFPESVRHENNNGRAPLHYLCRNDNMDDGVGLKILKLLFEKYPGAVRHYAARDGMLPIHFAAAWQSPEFCRTLIKAYPDSERITTDNGHIPFHYACGLNTIATVKYLYQLYPESINVADNQGNYPIRFAIDGIKHREDNSETAIEMIQFLLDCNPDVVLQKSVGELPLYWVCAEATNVNTSKLNAYLKILQILYDAHPEAIESNGVTSVVDEFCAEVQTFLNTQLTYARKARDLRQMITSDENGQLPLHKALRGNVTLGSIKLLVKGNASAITCADNRGMIPLHVACQHHASASIVEYLINLDPTSLHRKDLDDNTALHHNTALHYACRGANHAIIALLTEKHSAVSVSKRNAHGQLPIDLLFASREVSDRESVEYTESIYRLLRAFPMTLMHYNLRLAGSDDCICQRKKKRKVDEL
jgi:ankyrin repeat protein